MPERQWRQIRRTARPRPLLQALPGDTAFKPSAGSVTVVVKDKTKPKLTLKLPRKNTPAATPTVSWVAKDKGGVRSVLVSSKVGRNKYGAASPVAPTASPLVLPPVSKGMKVCVKVIAVDWAGNRSKPEVRCGTAK